TPADRDSPSPASRSPPAGMRAKAFRGASPWREGPAGAPQVSPRRGGEFRGDFSASRADRRAAVPMLRLDRGEPARSVPKAWRWRFEVRTGAHPRHLNRRAVARARARRRSRRRGTVLTALLALLATLAVAAPAPAATVYEIVGEWTADTPQEVGTDGAVAARWWLNLNDDATAPGNAPVDDVVVTFAATNAVFDELPPACLTDGVTPPSSVSEDGSTLECNLGRQVEGSALTLVTGMRATGAHGDEIGVGASIGDASVELPHVTVANEFLQDIRWEQN